jgi:hypothetical protein
MNSQECLTPQATTKKKPFQYPINKKKKKSKHIQDEKNHPPSDDATPLPFW